MAHFIRIELLGDLGEIKINLDNVNAVSRYKKEGKNIIEITFINGTTKLLQEGVTILDVEKVFNKFPC